MFRLRTSSTASTWACSSTFPPSDETIRRSLKGSMPRDPVWIIFTGSAR